MHGIGRVPILGILVIALLVQAASAYTIVVDEIGGNITIDVPPIQESFFGSGQVTVAIFNNLNRTINVTVDSGVIKPSDSNFMIHSKDSYVIGFTFKKDFKGQFRYVISSSDFQKVVYQSVDVDVKGAGLSFPKELSVTLEERSITKKFVTFTNTGDVPIDVRIDVSGSDAVIAAVPNEFTLDVGDSMSVAYVIYGINETVSIPVTYKYDDETEVIMQKISVKTTPMKEVIQNQELLKSYEEQIKKLKLEGNVKLEVPSKAVVGNDVVIKATLNNKPIDDAIVLVKSGDFSSVIILSGGKAVFTPEWAGSYEVELINGFGEVIASKQLTVVRAKWNLTIPEQTVGKPFVVSLPEVASIKILKDGALVLSDAGKSSYNITLDKPGTYTLKFVGKKYEGEATFKVTGTISITITQAGKVVMPGSTIKAGSPLKVAATIAGVPVKGTVRVMYPANAYGYDERDISALMMQQMFMQMYMSSYGVQNTTVMAGGMMFVPPDNIVIEYPLNGAAAIPLPDSTSGYVTVTFLTEDGKVAGQYTFKVEPKTPLGGYEPYVVLAFLVALVVTVLYKKGWITVPDKLKVRFGEFRAKFKKSSGDLPDLE